VIYRLNPTLFADDKNVSPIYANVRGREDSHMPILGPAGRLKQLPVYPDFYNAYWQDHRQNVSAVELELSGTFRADDRFFCALPACIFHDDHQVVTAYTVVLEEEYN
jgi:hypothetical protein